MKVNFESAKVNFEGMKVDINLEPHLLDDPLKNLNNPFPPLQAPVHDVAVLTSSQILG